MDELHVGPEVCARLDNDLLTRRDESGGADIEKDGSGDSEQLGEA